MTKLNDILTKTSTFCSLVTDRRACLFGKGTHVLDIYVHDTKHKNLYTNPNDYECVINSYVTVTLWQQLIETYSKIREHEFLCENKMKYGTLTINISDKSYRFNVSDIKDVYNLFEQYHPEILLMCFEDFQSSKLKTLSI